MTPTMELRFVEREVRTARTVMGEVLFGGGAVSKTVRILQQKWVGTKEWYHPDGGLEVDELEEWRDVPVEKETDRDPT